MGLQAHRLRSPRSTKLIPPSPLFLLQLVLVPLRDLLFILLVDSLQLMRNNDQDTPQVVCRTELFFLEFVVMTYIARWSSHELAQYADFQFDSIMLGDNALERVDPINMAGEEVCIS